MQPATFKRSNYYSQTEVIKTYKISVKGYQQMIADHSFYVVSVPINQGDYTMMTIYVAKQDVESLNLVIR